MAQCFIRSTLGETWKGTGKGACVEKKDWEDWNVGERLQSNMKRVKMIMHAWELLGKLLVFSSSFPWTTACIKDEYYTTIVSPFFYLSATLPDKKLLGYLHFGLGREPSRLLLLVLFPLYSTNLGREST